jgi:hypothetical protein
VEPKAVVFPAALCLFGNIVHSAFPFSICRCLAVLVELFRTARLFAIGLDPVLVDIRLIAFLSLGNAISFLRLSRLDISISMLDGVGFAMK